MSPADALRGARIRRIDAPSGELLAFTIAAGDVEEVLIAALGGEPRGIGLVAERPRGLPASAFVRQLRVHVQGARIEDLREEAPGVVRLDVARAGSRASVVLEIAHGNVVLVGGDGTVLGGLHPSDLRKRGLAPGAPWTGSSPAPRTRGQSGAVLGGDVEVLQARGPELIAGRAQEHFDRAKIALGQALERAEKKLARRLDAIEQDAARAALAPELRRRGNLILGNLGAIARGARTAQVTDWESDPPAVVTLELDPARDAREQAEAAFKRARKVETGGAMAAARAQETREEIARLAALRAWLVAARDVEGVSEIAEQAHRARVVGAREVTQWLGGETKGARPGRKAAAERRLPYRRFLGSGERPILVGRGAADNDELTLHGAKPHDLWMHAKGMTGAHVVVPLRRNEACPPELLVDAATLAAHFSDARGESIVDVAYVARRHVRKPKGSPPGLVVVEREKVLALRLEADRLKRLLASESIE